MIRNYLKITFRSLWKNRTFVAINTLGMGIALACCIVAFLNWKYNDDWDSQHENAEEIYRINFIRITNGSPIKNGSSPTPLGNAIRDNISQLDAVVRLQPTGGNFKVGDELFRINVAKVEDQFFDLFSYDFIAGDQNSISDLSTIIIDDETAEKYFPDGNALGEVVTYISGDFQKEFKVGGIFRKPQPNSSFRYSAYVNFYVQGENPVELDEDWEDFTTTFVRVPNPADIPAITNELQNYIEIQNKAKPDYKVEEFYLDPFEGMAQRAEREEIWNHWFWNSLPRAAVIAPAVMSGLILLIACFNFTNTSIAIANRRLKEIGIRKVMGSRRAQLTWQFLGENLMLCLFALILSLMIAWFLVPAYSSMWPFLNLSFDLTENLTFYFFLILLLLATGIVSGSYPAFYVSGLEPTAILRGRLKYGGTSRVTRFLLMLQFAISLIAIISSIMFTQNAQYQKDYDMGYRKSGLLFSYVGNGDDYQAYRNEIANDQNVIAVSGSAHNIATSWYTDPIKYDNEELDVMILDISDDYFETIGAVMKDGRNFVKDSQTDVEQSVIVSEELVRVFDWEEPVGKRILWKDTVQLYIVGVVKDVYLNALWDPLDPVMFRYIKPEKYTWMTVLTDPDNSREVHDLMEAKWKNVFPDRLPAINYIEDVDIAENAQINGNIRTMFLFLGAVALLLSASGLYSMVTLNIIKKMKEIGVRKVLGASITNIAYLVNRQFLISLGIASVVGSLLGYLLNDLLMGSIWAYHIGITPIPFVFAVVILFVISLVTVGQKVFRAANANPAYTLRDE